jgi:Holliday junction resolvase RusA-like endonuclease
MTALLRDTTAAADRGAGDGAPATATPDPICIRLPGEPRGKSRPRFWNGRAVTPEATRSYENDLRHVARSVMRSRVVLQGPIRVRVEALMPVPASWSKSKRALALAGQVRPTGKPDADNVLKTLDALNGVVWLDDAQIVEATITKLYSADPALIIQVRPLGHD